MKNLEQIRAANALVYAKAGQNTRGQQGGNVLKKLPALVMGNGLLAAVGLAHERDGVSTEPALITAGNEVAHLAQFLKPGCNTYTAQDVIKRLLAEPV